MKKIKIIIHVLITLITCFSFSSCDYNNEYNKVKEATNELINKKLVELENEYNDMYDKLVENNLLPNNVDKTITKIQTFNGITYSLKQPVNIPGLSYIENKYNLPEEINFYFNIEFDNILISYSKYYYFREQKYSTSIMIRNYESVIKGFDDLSFNKFEKELNFFNTYINLEKNLVNELNGNLDYKYLIENFDINKKNLSLKEDYITKLISNSLTNSTKIEYFYEILQNKETFLYGNSFSIIYTEFLEDI